MAEKKRVNKIVSNILDRIDKYRMEQIERKYRDSIEKDKLKNKEEYHKFKKRFDERIKDPELSDYEFYRLWYDFYKLKDKGPKGIFKQSLKEEKKSYPFYVSKKDIRKGA